MAGNHERRWHPLLEQWVIIAATTGNRPWQGDVQNVEAVVLPEHDKACYLCPGTTRANGEINPDYSGPFAFDNDFASFSFTAPDVDNSADTALMHCEQAHGICRVLCWTERHDKTLASLSADGMTAVVKLWQSEYQTLSQHPDIEQVLIFENKGAAIGVSNPHPHGQVYATSFVSDTFTKLQVSQQQWYQAHDSLMLLDLIARDEYQQSLRVTDNQHFVAVVPFFARFAYECWIIPKFATAHVGEMDDEQLVGLGQVYQRMAKAYNQLFQQESPNISLLYNAPTKGAGGRTTSADSGWQFHLVMQPPLREPDKLKYLAGFESGCGNIVNPVQPEVAAERLRSALSIAMEQAA